MTRIRARCRCWCTHVREQQACMRQCTCTTYAGVWCTQVYSAYVLVYVHVDSISCRALCYCYRLRWYAYTNVRGQRGAYHLAVSSTMAHISLCLQHKLRSRHACRELFRARNLHFDPPYPISYFVYGSHDVFPSSSWSPRYYTLVYISRKPCCFRGQPRRQTHTTRSPRFL